MRTFSLLKNLPIYNQKNGVKLGEVCDVCIAESGNIEGLLIKEGGLFKKSRYVDMKSIHSFGPDGVMIEDKTDLKPYQPRPFTYTLSHKHPLVGKTVLTSEGERLGLLEDVYFMEEVGTIVGYEITDGFFSDITEGKRVVKVSDAPTIGRDAIIIPVDFE